MGYISKKVAAYGQFVLVIKRIKSLILPLSLTVFQIFPFL